MTESPNLDAVHSALKAVKLLRCTVGDVFKCLADCPLITNSGQSGDEVTPNNTPPTTTNTTNNNTTNNSTQSASNASPTAANGNQLAELQTLLSAVNSRFRELETACTLLTPSLNASPTNISLGNSSLLGQDPNYDKTNLYSDMISSYRWSDKMIEYSTFAATLLQQNSLKRALIPSIYVKGRQQRRPPNGHNINTQQIDLFIAQLQKQVFQDLVIEVVRPFGAPTVLKVTIPRVLRACILLRGLLIEWVVVKGYDETFDDSNSDNSYVKRIRTNNAITEPERLEIWSESKYEVFRKVSEHANAAMLHFYSPTHCDVAIKTYLTWLKSYSNLFSAPCRKCECRLQNFMPPTWRDVRLFEAYHEQCRP